jgi:hypothetical protein
VHLIPTHLAHRVQDFLAEPALNAVNHLPRPPYSAAQIQLQLEYRRMVEDGRELPRPGDVGFKCYSQCDEDGILLYLFGVLGVSKKLCVEISAGNGIECNTANLVINHGWHSLMVDGDAQHIEQGRSFYSQLPETSVFPPQMLHAWVTRDGVNALLSHNGFTGDIDLLSLDVDGVDYWIWEAIEVVTPRVVVVEYQDILGPDRSWTVPYADRFSATDYHTTNGMPDFAGASLGAFVKLARRKGYRLVSVNRYGFNAFFVRNGLGDALIPAIEPRECFDHPKVVQGMRERFPAVKDLPWQEV